MSNVVDEVVDETEYVHLTDEGLCLAVDLMAGLLAKPFWKPTHHLLLHRRDAPPGAPAAASKMLMAVHGLHVVYPGAPIECPERVYLVSYSDYERVQIVIHESGVPVPQLMGAIPEWSLYDGEVEWSFESACGPLRDHRAEVHLVLSDEVADADASEPVA